MQCSMRSHTLFPGILAPFLLRVDTSSPVVFYTKSTETRGSGQNTGCLSFTRANRSVHGLGKWFAKFTGADPGFFLGGGALVSCCTSTPINHIVFFCRIPIALENRWSSRTRSAPGSGLVNFVPESRLPFVEISSIYRKTAVKA